MREQFASFTHRMARLAALIIGVHWLLSEPRDSIEFAIAVVAVPPIIAGIAASIALELMEVAS